MRSLHAGMSRRCAILEFGSLEKHALECLRLEAECNQLAFRIGSRALRLHFLQMADEWRQLADHGLTAPGA